MTGLPNINNAVNAAENTNSRSITMGARIFTFPSKTFFSMKKTKKTTSTMYNAVETALVSAY